MAYLTKLALSASVAGMLCSSAASAGETVSYTYDRLGRLVKVVRDKPSNDVQTCYKLDRADNRTQVKTEVNVNVSSLPPCP